MTNGVTVQSQARGAPNVDLGLWLSSQVIAKPMAMGEAHLNMVVEMIAANRFVLPRDKSTSARITENGTAIVEVHGILINRAPVLGSFWGLTAYEGLIEQFRRLSTNKAVKRVVLDINSPGGMVTGLQACADALVELRKKKPVHALAHDMAASAGYWIAAACSDISVTRDGEVGSIGVRMSHVSYAEALDRAGIAVTTMSAGATKADGSIENLLSPGTRAEWGYEMERLYDKFVAHVASHRPISEDEARETDARTFAGQDAVAIKLADRVETLESMIERLERSSKSASRKPGNEPASPASGTTQTGASRMSTNSEAGAPATVEQITQAIQATIAPKQEASAPSVKSESEIRGEAAAEVKARISKIIGCDAAKGREELANHFAFETEMSAEAAITALTKAPKGAAAEAQGDAAQGEFDGAFNKQMAQPGSSAGVTPDGKAPADGSNGVDERAYVKHVAKRCGMKVEG